MKKALIFALVCMLIGVSASVPAYADTTIGVGTSLVPDTSGGTAPVVQAKWEANASDDDGSDYTSPLEFYRDDDTAEDAQFAPSGQYQVNKKIAICAIVSDPDGINDVKHVYADVYYPIGIAVGESHVKLESQTGSSTAGCGVLMQEDELGTYNETLDKYEPLSKDDGIALFCGTTNSVRGSNNNLPKFGPGYDYTAICKADGTLQKETAKVYCTTKEISYEDPSGEYRVKAVVVDTAGKSSTLTNYFDYLASTAFETDFTSIAYGNVRLETEKIINGDLAWATDDGTPDWVTGPLATVRNVGNARLAMTVEQNDMNFGHTGSNWNVYYKARIGNEELDWTQYDPNIEATLKDELDLSERDEIDFAIYVKKFPDDVTDYSGTMTLGAVYASHLTCDPLQSEMRHISLENKDSDWQVLPDDQTYGDIEYSHNYTDFRGTVTGTGLVPGGKYQITLNGPNTGPEMGCLFTNVSLGEFAGGNTFSGGFWNSAYPNLSPVCTADDEEGLYNMNLIGDHYTFIAGANGEFTYPFAFALPAGDYVGVKVLVKKMLDTHVSPWSDTTGNYPEFNLYETAAISFTVL